MTVSHSGNFGLATLCRTATLTVFVAASLVGATPSDPKAEALAKTMMDTMGGYAAWKAAQFIRFDYIVKTGGKAVTTRSHLWDKRNGRYRLEDQSKDGKLRVSLFSTVDLKGVVYVDGKALNGEESTKAIKEAYSYFINDMYWLAMPWKWLEPGVQLKYMGTQNRGGQAVDVVELTFDHVGLTPGDKYLAFVSPKTHLMEHWEYTYQDGTKGSWDWKYIDSEGIKLAGNHTSGGNSINMGEVQVLDSVTDAIFTDYQHSLSGLR